MLHATLWTTLICHPRYRPGSLTDGCNERKSHQSPRNQLKPGKIARVKENMELGKTPSEARRKKRKGQIVVSGKGHTITGSQKLEKILEQGDPERVNEQDSTRKLRLNEKTSSTSHRPTIGEE